MKQVVQAINGGPVRVIDVPRPTIGATEVLVQSLVTTLSPGTERAVTQLARSSLVAKARARPDLVRQVVKKARTEGLAATAKTVRARLDDDMPLGYSGAGVAVEVGDAVAGVVPGQLVATGGAGKANHAEFQAVPALLCVPVPDGVTAEQAAFATIGAIALHGLRLAGVAPGSKVVVIGLGLVGQLAARQALAAGCDVFGIDLDPDLVARTEAAGCTAAVEAGDATTDRVMAWSRGRGADAVVITAASKTSAVIHRAPALCRDKAVLSVVGDVGLELDRRPLFDKELDLRIARSYGPGRYERTYEDWGVDYPAGEVRWTEGRNLETVLDLIAGGRLDVSDLVTHTFPIDEAGEAYALIDERREPVLGVQLRYAGAPADEPAVVLRRRSTGAQPGVGLIGAGSFARGVLLPALRDAGFDRLVAVTSASGLSARHLAERAGFEQAVSGAEAVIEDPDVDVVVIATPHDTHAALAAAALRVGKHVFCEKPLALSFEELDAVEAALATSAGTLTLGFNRRWSEPVRLVRAHLGDAGSPLVLTYRISAGRLPENHWYHDRRQGGRLLGEVCHFVDTCAAIVGAPATSVHAVGGGADDELALSQDIALVLRYPGGSVAAITYAAGGFPATEKERLEVLGRGRTAVINDFREVILDGRSTAIRPQDKGHAHEARVFRQVVTGERQAGAEAIESTRTTLEAAAALGRP